MKGILPKRQALVHVATETTWLIGELHRNYKAALERNDLRACASLLSTLLASHRTYCRACIVLGDMANE